MQDYKTFRLLLETEGVRSCLPDLRDDDVDTGVQIYESFKSNGESYAELQKTYRVLALRLADVGTPPYRPFSRTESTALGKVLSSSTGLQFLTRIGSGSFAQVCTKLNKSQES